MIGMVLLDIIAPILLMIGVNIGSILQRDTVRQL